MGTPPEKNVLATTSLIAKNAGRASKRLMGFVWCDPSRGRSPMPDDAKKLVVDKSKLPRDRKSVV